MNGILKRMDRKQKREVYFNEYNVLMNKVAYLPFSSGLLRAYAETSRKISENYIFMPFLFYREPVGNILNKYNNPSVVAFSTTMWNEQLNLKVAEKVKQKFPDCLIVFGGPSVPYNAETYYKQYPFIDVTVRGAGEAPFLDILTRFIEGCDFSGIPGISWRSKSNGSCVKNSAERELPKDLDIYPSPYQKGLYEYLFENNNDLSYQAIIETNRGCPFPCTYCYWGQGGLNRRYQFHSIERVAAEIEWVAKHKIRYLFNADSNFGINDRDWEIANILVEIKKKYGYPEKLRTCFGKNTDEKIYRIAVIIHKNELEKGITLSRQSNDINVLKNVRRQNIKISTYENLQSMFNKENIPTYTELILGLPGESYPSFIKGIDDILHSGLRNQLFIYQCQVYPNTELADSVYQEKYGIKTKRIVLTEIHAAFREPGSIPEYEDIIISTASMPLSDWRKMTLYAWVVMLFHGLKLGFYLLIYLSERFHIKFSEFFKFISERDYDIENYDVINTEIIEFGEQVIEKILRGEERGIKLPEFGNLYWDIEEAMFLMISEKSEEFYNELGMLAKEFLTKMGHQFDEAELLEVIQYQRMIIPKMNDKNTVAVNVFSYNIPEYFEKSKQDICVAIKKNAQKLKVQAKDYKNDKVDFAREVMLWGRKSGKIENHSLWEENQHNS